MRWTSGIEFAEDPNATVAATVALFVYIPRNRLMNGWLTFNTSGRCFSRS